LPTGAEVMLFNGDGQEYSAQITDSSKSATTVLLASAHTPPTESSLTSVLGLGISRGERMDYAIQKSTELGVTAIVPLFTEHCEVRLDAERLDKRMAHWQQIIISACEQCGRVRLPELRDARTLDDFTGNCGDGLKLLFDQRQQEALPEASPPGGVVLLIGPEGGFSTTEIARAHAAGFRGIALGPRVLRTETAPVAALSVLQYLWDRAQ